MANFSKGERYQSKLLNDYQNNLQLSGLFNIVSIKPSLKDKKSNPRIPILVQYEPIDKTQYRIGFGYNTDTQFNGSIGYTQNRLGERGEKINTEIHLSEKKVDLQANIFIPKSHPKFDFYTIETQYLDETIITENRDKNIYLTFNHTWIENYSQTHFFDRKMSVIYTIDWSKAENEPTIKRQLIYPKLVYQYIFKSPERTIIASLGAEIEGNTEFLLSKLSFYKVLLHSNIRTSEFYNLRLLIKNRFGILDSSNTLPLSWYFRTGGTYSVRGFDYESIGAEELSQNKMMFTHTTEIQRKLYESIYASLFYDAGNASEDIFTSKASQSLGTGLVWESPFGDIELSLAWPIQNYSIDQDHYKFHIALKKGFY